MNKIRRSFGLAMLLSILCSVGLILLNTTPVQAVWPTIIYPSAEGITLVKGGTYTILWEGVHVDPVNIVLWTEDMPNDFYGVLLIASGIPNSGSYSWTVPYNLPNGSNYVIEVGNAMSDNNFTISDSAPLPVTLISPEENAVLDNGCSDPLEPLAWDFSWNPFTGASQYHLYVIGSNAIYPVIDNSAISTTSYHYESQGYIIYENRFDWTWKVRALVSGTWTDWSAIRSFDVEPMCSSVYLPVIQQNAVLDFPAGLWLYDHDQWFQLHIEPTTQLEIADLDNNDQQDILVDFGASYGVWLYMNNSTWTQLHSVTSEGLTVGDIDNNGLDDIVIDFGAQYGLWLRMNNNTWTQLHSISPESFVTADMDNNGYDDIIIDFGSAYGVWTYKNNSIWQQLHGISSSYLASGDMDGNGQADVIVDFGSVHGIWGYYNNNSWIQLHSVSNNIQPVIGDLDGNGRDDVVIDFGGQLGIWAIMNNSSWVQLHGTSSEQMSVRYLDDNYQADLLVDFGSQLGLWVWKNNTTWEQLHSVSPDLMVY